MTLTLQKLLQQPDKPEILKFKASDEGIAFDERLAPETQVEHRLESLFAQYLGLSHKAVSGELHKQIKRLSAITPNSKRLVS